MILCNSVDVLLGEMMLTGDIRVIRGGLADFLLLPCGATSLSGFDIEYP